MAENVTGSEPAPTWWELGFGYDVVVDAWQDARLATAIERTWLEAGKPPDAHAWWMASADEYAFRWFLNETLGNILDSAKITWRDFVIGKTERIPPQARPFLPPVADDPQSATDTTTSTINK
ncbi:MAG: hypothetical protein HY698_06130 [Deltaproteobacteria bacterium]|nr:hypothetical protein [Deltaproteobacteria bacterium]